MALTVLSVFLRGLNIFGLILIGRGHFSEVYSCRDSNGHPTGLVVKVSKTASSLDSIKEGQAGTEAYALFLGEMLALSGAQSPFVRVNRRLILVAAPAERGQYVSVLFMEEGVRTGTADVLKLATEIHMPNGSFSPAGLKEAGNNPAHKAKLLSSHRCGASNPRPRKQPHRCLHDLRIDGRSKDPSRAERGPFRWSLARSSPTKYQSSARSSACAHRLRFDPSRCRSWPSIAASGS